MDILTKCFSAIEDHHRATGTNLDELVVSPAEYKDLTLCMRNDRRMMYPPKPKPPVKRHSISRWLFGGSEEVEYDYHAPEYLKELSTWEARWWDLERSEQFSSICLNTPYGVTKIIV